uniref:Amino acid transporter transmembrane domain-containing protein n=1 Tax=Sarcophilus harrisii TaxID=9305 RepID=A0A7N4NMY5_SARHA
MNGVGGLGERLGLGWPHPAWLCSRLLAGDLQEVLHGVPLTSGNWTTGPAQDLNDTCEVQFFPKLQVRPVIAPAPTPPSPPYCLTWALIPSLLGRVETGVRKEEGMLRDPRRLAHSKLSPGEGPGPRKSFGGGLENVGDNDNPWWLAPLFSPDTPSHPGLFVCHPEVLPIYTELRRPSQRRMQAVANMSIGAMFLMYGLTATFGYLTFFGHVEAEMLHMYSQDLLILCVRLAVLMAVTLTIPVVLFPIRRAIQQLLFPTKAFSWTRHGTIALVLLALVNVLVIFVPDIRDIFGVIGATSAPSLIFILPSIFYIRIIPREREALTSRPKLQATAFTALGVVIMAMSLGFIFTDWAIETPPLGSALWLLGPSLPLEAPGTLEKPGPRAPEASLLHAPIHSTSSLKRGPSEGPNESPP